jgi:hypothetical protein
MVGIPVGILPSPWSSIMNSERSMSVPYELSLDCICWISTDNSLLEMMEEEAAGGI